MNGPEVMHAHTEPRVLRVGEWRVEPGLNRLSRSGESVHLEPKSMEVLIVLARCPGHVVSRDQLLATVWAGTVVGDDTLTQAVIKLRKALGDDSRAPAYIETIAKRGYRLLAPVTVETEQSRAPISQTPLPGGTPSPRRWPWRIAGLAVLLLGLVLVGRHGGEPAARAPDLPSPPPLEAAVVERLPTLMVFPFESLGRETPHYLAQGIAADLSTDLARLGELRVIRAPLAGGAAAGRAARYLVSGSVQRLGDRIKINVWLLDAASGRQIWSERHERPHRDLIALQEEIVGHLALALPIHIDTAERRRLAFRHTRNLEAYELFLRGYAAHLTHQEEENRQAREFYRQALALDPAFARAYAGLAMTWADEYRYQWSPDGEGALKRAMDLAQTAHEINPEVREVYWVRAYVHLQRRQPGRAIEALKRAIALDPSYADAYAFMGAIYGYSGQADKAIPLLRHGMRLNPDAGYLYFMSLGEAYFFLGEHEQALLNLREALARNPTNLETRVFLAAALSAAGDLPGAAWEVQEIRAQAPGFGLAAWLETSPIADPGQRRRVITRLAPFGL